MIGLVIVLRAKGNGDPRTCRSRTRAFAAVFGSVLVAAPLTAKPNLILEWGHEGTGDGEFDSPVGIDHDAAGYLYVVDYGNHRIQKFTGFGQHVLTWGSYGTGDGQFIWPFDVAAAPDGTVYVAGGRTRRIQRFTSDGVFLSAWFSELGEWPDKFRGIDIDSDGNVYAAATFPARVEKYGPEGNFITSWLVAWDGSHAGAYGLELDSRGDVYIVDPTDHQVVKFTSEGDHILSWGSFGSGPGEFDTPLYAAETPGGLILVTDYGNRRVQLFTDTGVYVDQWNEPGWPRGVTVNPSGYIFVVDRDNRVRKYGYGPVSVAATTWARIKAMYRSD